MNKNEQVDLLIRIDERVQSMGKTVDGINSRINDLKCEKINKRLIKVEEKTKVNTRLVWTGIASSLSALAYLIKIAIAKALT